MAKTTRKTATPGAAPTPRAARPKPAAKASTTGTPAPKASKTARARTTAPARTTQTASTAAAEPAVAPTHHEIAERAYHIHLRRHGRPGNPDHDWLQAIEELRAERRAPAKQ
jgi:hypothetical protein